ncbi:hypothetical protein H920_20361 [Fukomys damarensis]|uniref:D-glutamate cyclase-like C-terminal domain-containing protein n=1 Tax=Fukomys damarensis TaxID=885580 RepID=A0A091CLM9_FUKDA|nr:hypothetical protein H920_20361 [Fukomys damarensis]
MIVLILQMEKVKLKMKSHCLCSRSEAEPDPSSDWFPSQTNTLTIPEDSWLPPRRLMVLKPRDGALFCKVKLLKASLSLPHACSILIITGLPTHFNVQPPEETEHSLEAIALATFLQALGKEVPMEVDQRALTLVTTLADYASWQGDAMATPPTGGLVQGRWSVEFLGRKNQVSFIQTHKDKAKAAIRTYSPCFRADLTTWWT